MLTIAASRSSKKQASGWAMNPLFEEPDHDNLLRIDLPTLGPVEEQRLERGDVVDRLAVVVLQQVPLAFQKRRALLIEVTVGGDEDHPVALGERAEVGALASASEPEPPRPWR